MNESQFNTAISGYNTLIASHPIIYIIYKLIDVGTIFKNSVLSGITKEWLYLLY